MEVQALGSQGMLLQGAVQGQHPLSLLVAAHEQQQLIQQVLGSEEPIRGLLGYLDPHSHIPTFPQSLPLTFALVGGHGVAGRLLGLTRLHRGVRLAGCQEGD